ncbi:glycoside hydrolase family 28 protein, partial [Zopfia rhizophila CBS 207.26]
LHGQATCTPLAQGYEVLDDTPLINDAILNCGNGGTIVLPADQIYSIRSPFNFSACHGCDFQVEGTLLMSSDISLWAGKDALFSLAGKKDVTIRSVTGTGAIDGNSIAYYARPRWDTSQRNDAPYFATITNGSSNIIFSGLTIKNVPMKFFHTNGNATNLRFENLILSVEKQEGDRAGIADWESTGFELGGVSNVSIDN